MSTQLKFLQGERLYLRPLTEKDCENDYVMWLNDEQVCHGNSHHVFPYTFESSLEYVRYANQTRDNLILAIVSNDNDKHVGNIALQDIHRVYRSAEFTILLGDKEVWGKEYGKEAGRLLCSHGFAALNLNRIGCGTFENNVAMQKLAAHLGMKEEGRRRQAAFKDGKYLDVIEYGVLKVEYEAYFAASGL